MNDQEIEELMSRYADGSASEEEAALIESWYMNLAAKEEIPESELNISQVKAAIWNRINRRRMIPFYRYAAAAILLIAIGIGGYAYFSGKKTAEIQTAIVHDLAPGANKAMLTLSNGKRIALTGAGNGTVAREKQIHINKTGEGKIVYQGKRSPESMLEYNTMTTPRGGKYQLTLSDGTEVTLDAASSIRYPVTFGGNSRLRISVGFVVGGVGAWSFGFRLILAGDERLVEITGQVYFEVAHMKSRPFRVKTHGQTVEVLGTHFNINAYDDETSLITTLLEGSIKVSNASNNAMLKPGQQSVSTSGNLQVKEANTDEAVAWKNGYFSFHKADIKTIMRQLARWYDVDIAYEGQIPDRRFSGDIDRNTRASRALEVLRFTKIHFRIEGKKIIVTP
jgi:transmembrane sensor